MYVFEGSKAWKPSITFTGCYRDETTILQGDLKALLRQGKGSREGGGCLEGRGRGEGDGIRQFKHRQLAH